MANKDGITIELVSADVRRLLADLQRANKQADPRVRKLIFDAGIKLQLKAKQEVHPHIKYGVLRSSIYMDWQGRVSKGQVKITPEGRQRDAQQKLKFPTAESERTGLDVVVGSEVDYAAKIHNDYKPYLSVPFAEIERQTYNALVKLTEEILEIPF